MVTAEEIIDIAQKEGVVEAARKVDVVTTGTFAPMCSSGAFINIGQSTPLVRTTKTWFNNVPAYSGVAAVDCYLGATQTCEDDPLNKSIQASSTTAGAMSSRTWWRESKSMSGQKIMAPTVILI